MKDSIKQLIEDLKSTDYVLKNDPMWSEFYSERQKVAKDLEEMCEIIDKILIDKDGISCLPGYERYHKDFPGHMGIVRWNDWEDRGEEDVEFDLTGAGKWEYRDLKECTAIDYSKFEKKKI